MIYEINNYYIPSLIWNIFLLSIPYFLSVLLKKKYAKKRNASKKMFFWIIIFLWLIFIPNSAYIITEARHLINYCPGAPLHDICEQNAWVIIFFFAYSLVGWFSFVYLMEKQRMVLKSIWGKKNAEIFVLSVIPMMTIGVLLGLIDRWNSWEIFMYPGLVLEDAIGYLVELRNFVVFTLFLYISYCIGRKILKF